MKNVFLLDLLQALRSARRHGWQAALSVVGIAVGTVCVALTTNWMWTDNNHDSFRDGYKDMYFVTHNSSPGAHDIVSHISYAMMPQLDSLFNGEIKYGVRNFAYYDRVNVPGHREEQFYKSILGVTPGFGDALNIRVLHGSLPSVLSGDGSSIAISQHVAELLFGTDDVIDREIELCSGWEEPKTCKVGAVMENCGESNIYYDALLPIHVSPGEIFWGNCSFNIVVQTTDTADVVRRLNQIVRPAEFQYDFSLYPLRSIHQISNGDADQSFLDMNFYPLAFSIIAALLLLSAVVNLITVYTSIFLGRTREYALRRSIGGTRWANIRWVLTYILPVVALGIALGVAGMLVGQKLTILPGDKAHGWLLFAEVAALTLVACLAGMAYPIYKLERAYRLSLGYGTCGRENSHGWLLLTQSFACALLLFITLGMQWQLYTMIHADLGFDRNNLLRVHTSWTDNHPRLQKDVEIDKDTPVRKSFSFKDIFWSLPNEFKAESAVIDDAIAMPYDIFNRLTRTKIALIPPTITTIEEEDALYKEWTNNYEQRDKMYEHSINYIELPYRAFDFFKINVNGNPLRQQDEQDSRINVLINAEARRHFALRKNGVADFQTGNYTHNTNCYQTSSENHIVNKQLNVQGDISLNMLDFHNADEPTLFTCVADQHECHYLAHDAVYVRYKAGHRAEAEDAIRRVMQKHDVPEERIIIDSADEFIGLSYEEETHYANLIATLAVLCVVITFSGVISLLLYALRMRRRSIAIRRVHGAVFADLFRAHLVPFALYTAAGALPAFVPAYLFMRKWMEYFHHGTTPGLALAATIIAAMLAVVAIIVLMQVKSALRARPVEVLKPES